MRGAAVPLSSAITFGSSSVEINSERMQNSGVLVECLWSRALHGCIFVLICICICMCAITIGSIKSKRMQNSGVLWIKCLWSRALLRGCSQAPQSLPGRTPVNISPAPAFFGEQTKSSNTHLDIDEYSEARKMVTSVSLFGWSEQIQN